MFVASLMSLCFLTFPIAFLKTVLFISFKNDFSKPYFAFFLSPMFISIYGFNQAFRLNLMILCNFSKTYPSFNACFKFRLFMIYSFLSCKFGTSFSTFSFSYFQIKGVNHCKGYVNCHDIEHQLQENIIFIVAFFKTFSILRCVLNPFKTIYRQLLWHYPSV